MRCATPCAGFAVRTWGAVADRLSLAAAVALATHSPTDPSLSTAAGGPPANWLGSVGAYVSDALLLLFGLGAVAVPAGDRHRRPQDAAPRARRPIGRGLLLAAVGAVLLGIALGLTSGSAVSGLARRAGAARSALPRRTASMRRSA